MMYVVNFLKEIRAAMKATVPQIEPCIVEEHKEKKLGGDRPSAPKTSSKGRRRARWRRFLGIRKRAAPSCADGLRARHGRGSLDRIPRKTQTYAPADSATASHSPEVPVRWIAAQKKGCLIDTLFFPKEPGGIGM